MKKILLFVSLGMLLLSNFQAVSQTAVKPKLTALNIGGKVPADVWKTIPRKKDTRLVILDSWSIFCSSCIAAFPRMVKLQQEFPEKLQVVLLNVFENEEQIKQNFESRNQSRKKDDLIVLPRELPHINGSKNLYALFPHTSVPHHIWLDGNGKVLAITNGDNATPENVQSVLNGTVPYMYYKDDGLAARHREVGWNKGFLQPALPELPAFFYSGFMRYSSLIDYHEMQFILFGDDTLRGTCRFNGQNQEPRVFFETAFREIGSSQHRRMIIETKNKEMFISPQLNDPTYPEWRSKYLLSYELLLPLEDKNNWEKVLSLLRQDVNRFFGSMYGIEGLVEKRTLRALVLIKNGDISSMKTSGGEPEYSGPGMEGHKEGLLFINRNFDELVSVLRGFEDMNRLMPFIDETGIDKNMKIDIKLTGEGYLENVRQQLHQYGLDIIEAEREVEVIVIKDKK